MFLASFSKGPCCFPYVLLITGYVVALEAVDDPTLLFLRVRGPFVSLVLVQLLCYL